MVDTIHLFPVLNQKLLDLLDSMSIEDFNKPTQFPSWTVKDICAHLLDTPIRRLSNERDHYSSPELVKISSYEDLVGHITKLADRWALAFSVVSPQILKELIEKYQDELYSYLLKLDPQALSTYPVSWAGENTSCNWFDIAREYTERWHHQMQIRIALNKEPLYERKLFYPVLATFMKALPYHYRNKKMSNGYLLCVNIEGDSGGKWYVEWNKEPHLINEAERKPDTTIHLVEENAWKIFTRWNDKKVYQAVVEGDQELGMHILKMNCLMIDN